MSKIFSPAAYLPLLLLLPACAPKASQSSALTEARLEASETKMAQLETRLATLEEKTGQLDGIGEGVQQLLRKLDELGSEGGQAKRKGPDPTAVYSMPIDGDPYIGPAFAKVTLVKGYDFYCGFCDRALPAMAELQKIYGKQLKIVFKNFVIHPDYARLPALAACAAHKQKRFMPMFDKIWEKGLRANEELDEPKLLAIAVGLKLNKKRFLTDMYGVCEDKVRDDFKSMSSIGASGTPVFYINGRFMSGAQPVDKYRDIIDVELKKADQALKSGTKLKDYYSGIVESGRKTL